MIEQIDFKITHGEYRATFVCPHCGLVYRRKRITPKEKQYSGQIDIVDYGWKWKETLKELLKTKKPAVVAREMHCDIRTVSRFGVDFGIIPNDKLLERQKYVAKGEGTHISFDERRKHYRQRWEAALKANPNASRSELRLIDSKSQSWLHENDTDWLEQNSPPSKKTVAEYDGHDDEYLVLVKNAVEQIKNASGKPIWTSLSAVARKSGIQKLERKIASGLLPKTSSYLEDNLETRGQWHRRKVVWAIQKLREQGLSTSWKRIKRIAAISEEYSKEIRAFAVEYLEQNLE